MAASVRARHDGTRDGQQPSRFRTSIFNATKMLLARTEQTVLVVAHAPALHWIVQAAENMTDPLNYRRPAFANAVPVAVGLAGPRVHLETLAIDPYRVLSGNSEGGV